MKEVCVRVTLKSHFNPSRPQSLKPLHCNSIVCSSNFSYLEWEKIAAFTVAITRTPMEAAVTENLGYIGPVFKIKSASSTRKKEGESPSDREDMKEECHCCPWRLSSLFPPTGHYYWSLSFFLSFITEVIKPCEGAPPCLITPTVNKRRSGGEGARRMRRREGGEERQMKKHRWPSAVLL